MTKLEEIQTKRALYKKLTKKLERLAQGELTLTDYMAEVGEKMERLDNELMEMITRQMQLDQENNRPPRVQVSINGGDWIELSPNARGGLALNAFLANISIVSDTGPIRSPD